MAGWGSGFAHALTQGVVGGLEGDAERQRKLIVLAAQKRAEQRAMETDQLAKDKFAHEVEQDRINNTIAGYTAGDTLITPATTPDTGVDPLRKTFDDQLNQGLSHPAGNQSSLQKPVKPGSLGRIPTYDIQMTPEGFDYGRSKQGQQQEGRDSAAMERTLAQIEGRLQTTQMGAELRRSLQAQADQTRRDIAEMRGEKDVKWQTVVTKDGSMVQVNPVNGETRPIGLDARDTGGGRGTGAGGQTVGQKNKAADVNTTLGTIDEALGLLKQHPQAVGIAHGRGIYDPLDQWLDAEGVGARAALASVSSNLLHALSGAAISPKEFQRLRQYVPTSTDKYDAAVVKLTRLRSELERSLQSLNAAPATPPMPARRSLNDANPGGPFRPGTTAVSKDLPRPAVPTKATPAQLRRAQSDPEYKQFLIETGKL